MSTPKTQVRAKRWQPIKTAPKDRLVLLSCNEHPEYPSYVCVGRWIDVPHTNEIHSFFARDGRLNDKIKTLADLQCVAKENAHWGDGYPGIMEGFGHCGSWHSWEFRGGILFRPTHWMPLPKPPSPRPLKQTGKK